MLYQSKKKEKVVGLPLGARRTEKRNPQSKTQRPPLPWEKSRASTVNFDLDIDICRISIRFFQRFCVLVDEERMIHLLWKPCIYKTQVVKKGILYKKKWKQSVRV
jgi:hypothetical protein